MTDTIKYLWEFVEDDCKNIVQQIVVSGYKPTMIVGIMRGGMIPAIIISHLMNVPIMSLNWSKRDFNNRDFGTYLDDIVKVACSTKERFLIVDDIVDSGVTFAELKSYANNFTSDLYWKKFIKFSSLIYNLDQDTTVDFYSRKISRAEESRWYNFPWELK